MNVKAKKVKAQKAKAMRKPSAIETLMPRMVGGRISEMATYSDLFENTPDAILLLDAETLAVADLNPAARAAFGSAFAEGSPFPDWAEPRARSSLRASLHVLRASRKVGPPFDCAFPAPAGATSTFEINACLLRLGDYGEVIQVIAKDVTKARADAEALHAAHAELDQLSRTDAMTGLHNFRALQARLVEEHERARRYQKPFAVILCDIDHFKKYNDQNGHPEGDKALRQVAKVLQARARQTDFVARYGGEEFVVLCPEVTAEQAHLLAESLRACVEKEVFPFGYRQPLGKVTLSLGVAAFPSDGATSAEVLGAADKALYESKAGGRNRVSLFAGGGKKKAA